MICIFCDRVLSVRFFMLYFFDVIHVTANRRVSTGWMWHLHFFDTSIRFSPSPWKMDQAATSRFPVRECLNIVAFSFVFAPLRNQACDIARREFVNTPVFPLLPLFSSFFVSTPLVIPRLIINTSHPSSLSKSFGLADFEFRLIKFKVNHDAEREWLANGQKIEKETVRQEVNWTR